MSLGFRCWSLSETGRAFCLFLVCCHGNQIFQPSIWGRLSFAGGRWCALFFERKRGFVSESQVAEGGEPDAWVLFQALAESEQQLWLVP